MQCFLVSAFHYAKDSDNFSRSQMERFRFPDLSIPIGFHKPVHCPPSLHSCREFRKGIKKNGENIVPFSSGMIFSGEGLQANLFT